MERVKKTSISLLLVAVMLTSCNRLPSIPPTSLTDGIQTVVPTVGTVVAATQTATSSATSISEAVSPASPTPLLFTDPSIPISERIVYYYFVTAVENPRPEGSVAISPDAHILAPTRSDMTRGPDTAANLEMALEAVLHDGRNGWINTGVEIVNVTFDNGHADVVLQGEYFAVGHVTLVAASMQILMTIFANDSVQTATVTLNGDTIGNIGISISQDARPVNYVFTRAEIETFMNEHAYTAP